MGEKRENFRRESSEEAKNFQLKRSGDGVLDLIFEESVGHRQAVMGDRVTFTQETEKNPQRECVKHASSSVWLKPTACEKQWKYMLQRKIRDRQDYLLDDRN